MILLDANLLIFANIESQPQHAKARTWLDQQLNGTTDVGIPWSSLLTFVRITSNRRVFPNAQTTAEVWDYVEDWLACPVVWIPQPTERHREVMASLLRGEANRSDLVSDAHLAALALEYGLTLCSADNDFARFKNLRWQNPLI